MHVCPPNWCVWSNPTSSGLLQLCHTAYNAMHVHRATTNGKLCSQMRASAAGINYEDMTRRAQEMLTASEAAAGSKRPHEDGDANGMDEDDAAKAPVVAANGVKVGRRPPDICSYKQGHLLGFDIECEWLRL